jgi:hypothetical protein
MPVYYNFDNSSSYSTRSSSDSSDDGLALTEKIWFAVCDQALSARRELADLSLGRVPKVIRGRS